MAADVKHRSRAAVVHQRQDRRDEDRDDGARPGGRVAQRRKQAKQTDDAAEDPDAAQMRRSIELLWGVEQQRPSRGPKPSLTIEGIVASASDLADREGLGALSMARIAKQLGFTTMSLYRYVQSKDELLMLITDASMGPAPGMDGIADWREGLTRWALASRSSYQRHPWILQVPITGPPIAPSSVSWLEAGLQALAETALTEQEKASTVLLVAGFVRNEVGLERDLSTHEDQQLQPGAPPAGTYGDVLRLVVREEDFPALHRAIESGAFDDDGEYGDDEFEFGLETVLDGIAVLVERRAPSRATAKGAKRSVRQRSRGSSSSSSG
jgi:AcrR family transcriptional regulator